MRPCLQLLSGLLLGLALACSGSSDHGTATPATPAVPAASGFTYTAPAGTGWRLVEDAASTPTRLLLDLVGPAGTLSRGVGFNLKAAAGVRFGTFGTAGSPIQDAGVYELLSADPTYLYEPSLLGGGVKAGNLLSVGIFQKDRRLGAKDSGTVLCQIALVFDAAAGLHKGDALALSVPKAKYMAGDIGAVGYPAWTSDPEYYDAVGKAHLVPMAVAVGTLTAQ